MSTTIWHELRVGDLVGWASGTYLAPLGAGRDATAEVVEALGGTPTADTLSDLGLQVSGVFASSGEVQSRTTISSRPGVFEALGDITLDVLGLPDDAVRGYRINITADAGAEDWTQEDAGAVHAPICHRDPDLLQPPRRQRRRPLRLGVVPPPASGIFQPGGHRADGRRPRRRR